MSTAEIPATDTYNETVGLLHHVARGFFAKNRVPMRYMDEAMSVCNMAWFKAFQSHTEGKAPFANYLCIVTYRKLTGWWNRERRDMHIHVSAIGNDGDQYDVEGREELETDIPEGLTEEASFIIQLVLNTPEELASVIDGKGGTPSNYSSSIREYLAKELGWAGSKIRQSFAELKEAFAA